ncbi:MAG: hypothetical protein IIY73_04420 [Solobacterium sp.]|nr:hypothetical protein [Solobacterium sp.]
MPEIVFQYRRTTARYRDIGDPEGDAWTFYDDGTVIHTFYSVGYKDPVRTITVARDPALSDAIREYIDAHDAEIRAIPHSLNNGSLDGYYDLFTFKDHCITGINVTHDHPDAADPVWQERYGDNRIHEAQLVALYRGIYAIIQQYLPDVRIPLRGAGIV